MTTEPTSPARRGRPDRVILELDGRSQSAAAWARELGVARSTLLRRLKSPRWSKREALTRPPDK